MQLRITRIDATLPMPKYETAGSCAFDVYARVDTVIEPKSLGRIPTNLIVCVPEGHVLLLCSRSSTPKKKGLLAPQGVGVIDQDFCGQNDEMLFQVWNFSDETVTVTRGERVAQALVVPIASCEIFEGTPNADSRGGFGSTGS